MFKHNGHVFFVRERNCAFYLVDDSTPGLEFKLPGCRNQAEAEALAWNIVCDTAA
jgi:hypothetical protein